MDRATSGEVVLLTGCMGFLGRHVLKFLVNDESVAEIRALDKSTSCSNDVKHLDFKDIGHDKVKLYRVNLLDVESCRKAFSGVDVVMHCAGLVSYDYPADVDELHGNNVIATENVVKLCIDESVPQLIHCSTTEITLQSCFRGGISALTIYRQESKLEVPEDNGERLIFGEYAASKLRAERIVLKANNALLANGKDLLVTVALRPTMLYGDGDTHFLPKILEIVKKRGGDFPRLCHAGGKQQITYVGNAAWGFLRAKKMLSKNPKAIAGLPVMITDDTLVEDLPYFCQRITRFSKSPVRVSAWAVPLIVSYLWAFVMEFFTNLGFVKKFKLSPCSVVAYSSSIILYNRARASIHLNYWPKFTHEQTSAIAARYYSEIYSRRNNESINQW